MASTATYPDAIITRGLGRDLTGEVKRVPALPGTQNPSAKGTERPWEAQEEHWWIWEIGEGGRGEQQEHLGQGTISQVERG